MSDTAETPLWLEGIEGEAVPRLIMSDAAVIRVVAGPGSGKTTGLKRRILRLVEHEHVDPNRIFVGTFTRAIAHDMAEAFGDHSGMRVSTLHSLAYALLREHSHALGGRELRFLLDYEKKALLYDVRLELGGVDTIRELEEDLRRLEAARSARRDLGDARFIGAVERWLRNHGGMLVEEVVFLATEALEAHDIERGLYDHVVVDEYQDLTRCEQELIELIWSEEGSLVVLGDDDQSIYGFRFNHPEGITGFAEHHPQVEDISIPDNWRCGSEIVHVANLMMEEAGSAKEPMVAKREIAGTATMLHWPSVEEEIAGLAEYMVAHSDTDFLVLVPKRFIGYTLRDTIGVEARTEFHQEAIEHPYAQRRFALASLLADPDDRIALRSWLGFHPDGGHANERNAPAYATVFDPDTDPEQHVERIQDGTLIPNGTGSVLLRTMVDRLIKQQEDAPDDLADLIDWLFDPEAATVAEEDEEKSARLAQDLQRLQAAAHRVRTELREPDLHSIVTALRYRIATRAPLIEREEEARVRIMTLHAAKGLEADVIVVAGAADQIIPGDSDDREEERRLLYVALTRARNELIISWPRSMPMKDAPTNYVRIDSVYTARGERRIRLSKSSLLPASDAAPQAGNAWLARIRPDSQDS